MANIQVHGLTDEVVQGLERRAASNNRTLEGEVRLILEEAAGQETHKKNAKFKARVDEIWRGVEPRPQTPAEVLIRLDRDGADDLGHRSV